MTRRVEITVSEVGQAFGCCAILRDARSRRRVGETSVRPYGMEALAREDGEALAQSCGWQVAP